MAEYKHIDGFRVDVIRKNLQDVLDKHFPKELGLAIRAGNAVFTPSNVVFKLEFACKSTDGLVMTKEATDFKRYSFSHPVNVKDGLGKTFRDRNGRVVRLDGYKPKGRRYPYIVTEVRTNKRFKYPRALVETMQPIA